jgi:hypothetical protein
MPAYERAPDVGTQRYELTHSFRPDPLWPSQIPKTGSLISGNRTQTKAIKHRVENLFWISCPFFGSPQSSVESPQSQESTSPREAKTRQMRLRQTAFDISSIGVEQHQETTTASHRRPQGEHPNTQHSQEQHNEKLWHLLLSTKEFTRAGRLLHELRRSSEIFDP